MATKFVTDALFEFKLRRNECLNQLYKLKGVLQRHETASTGWYSKYTEQQKQLLKTLLIKVNGKLNELSVLEYSKGINRYKPVFDSIDGFEKEIRSEMKCLS